jgi:hypothetical protein
VSRTRFTNRVGQEWSVGKGAKSADDIGLSHISVLRLSILLGKNGVIILAVRNVVRQGKEIFMTSVLKRGRSLSGVREGGKIGEIGSEQTGGRNPSNQPCTN